MWLKSILRKIIYKERSSSQAYISYMRSKGARIGERVTIFSPKTTNIDMTAFCRVQRTPMRFRADAVQSTTDALKQCIFSYSRGFITTV